MLEYEFDSAAFVSFELLPRKFVLRHEMIVGDDSAGILPKGKNELVFGDLVAQNITMENHFFLLNYPALNLFCLT